VKILIHSNGPTVLTGYGVQVNLLAKRLQAAGHDVAISAYYGQQNGTSTWNGMTVYPVGFDAYGNDILHMHALHHFDGDPRGGWILTLMDVFGLTSPMLSDFNVAAWCPVDHFPVPPEVLSFFKRTGAVPIAMSKFGEGLLRESGLDPLYVPLAVDTDVYRPTPTLDVAGKTVTARGILGLDDDQFVVMMNGMNKGWAIHRKGFPHAFLAFADFAKRHPDAVLYMHTEELGGAGGYNLKDLAVNAGVPLHQLRFADQYAYRLGMPAELLAAAYTAADVLLAPSMGEGFCVPLIEAQACGTPVIVTDFSAQPELVGAGWKVTGQPWWEAPQSAWMISPDIASIVKALDDSYDADRTELAPLCIDKGRGYDADLVFENFWRPVLAELDPAPVELARPPMPRTDAVAVLVPCLNRPENVAPLVDSFEDANDGSAALYLVCDADDADQIAAVKAANANLLISDRGSTYAQKVNSGFEQTTEPWVFLCGDDVRFHPGWIQAARDLSDRFDVIGTNDSPTGEGNPRVAAGVHADHFFVRRSYVDTYGGNLGPGVMSEKYRHFFCDVETVELAKARKVFTPCLASLVEHMHPDLGKAEVDDVYRAGWGQREHDAAEWEKRRPLVDMQKQGRAR
jgi:glycosyltransferase involved in cell wall biosynthesis